MDNTLGTFFAISLMIQLVHTSEELSTGFHKSWYIFKMPFMWFLVFELLFNSFWITILLIDDFPGRLVLQSLFLVLMFANGVQHLVWWGVAKKYVPGLVTAFLHIILFLIFYFTIQK